MAELAKRCPPRPDLEARMKEAIARHNALPPLERAIDDLKQKRSFVRGNLWNQPPEQIDAHLDTLPEFVVLAALERAQAEIATLRANLVAAQASERERCAQRALQARAESGSNNAVFAHGWDAGCAWTYIAIRSLSPTPNQEKPE